MIAVPTEAEMRLLALERRLTAIGLDFATLRQQAVAVQQGVMPSGLNALPLIPTSCCANGFPQTLFVSASKFNTVAVLNWNPATGVWAGTTTYNYPGAGSCPAVLLTLSLQITTSCQFSVTGHQLSSVFHCPNDSGTLTSTQTSSMSGTCGPPLNLTTTIIGGTPLFAAGFVATITGR